MPAVDTRLCFGPRFRAHRAPLLFSSSTIFNLKGKKRIAALHGLWPTGWEAKSERSSERSVRNICPNMFRRILDKIKSLEDSWQNHLKVHKWAWKFPWKSLVSSGTCHQMQETPRPAPKRQGSLAVRSWWQHSKVFDHLGWKNNLKLWASNCL